MKEFTTDRLRLRRLVASDIPILQKRLYSDPEFRRFEGDLAAFERFGEELLLAFDTPVGRRVFDADGGDEGFGVWGIERRRDGALLGQVRLGGAERVYWLSLPDAEAFVPFEVELSCALDPAYRGQGYSVEACRPLIDYAFAELDLRRLASRVDQANVAALALARRLGYSLGDNGHREYGGRLALLEQPVPGA